MRVRIAWNLNTYFNNKMYKYLLNRITVGMLFADSGSKQQHINGDTTRTKKHSVTDSVHSKRSRYSDVDEKGRSVNSWLLLQKSKIKLSNFSLYWKEFYQHCSFAPFQVLVVRVLREMPRRGRTARLAAESLAYSLSLPILSHLSPILKNRHPLFHFHIFLWCSLCCRWRFCSTTKWKIVSDHSVECPCIFGWLVSQFNNTSTPSRNVIHWIIVTKHRSCRFRWTFLTYNSGNSVSNN